MQGDASRPQILDNLKRVEGRSGTGDRSFGAINTSPFASLANSGPPARAIDSTFEKSIIFQHGLVRDQRRILNPI